MIEKKVDARGLACPQPVVLARKAMLDDGVERVTVLVDSDVQAENVQRLAKSRGWTSSAVPEGKVFCVTAVRGGPVDGLHAVEAASAPSPEPAAPDAPVKPSVVVFVASDLFGKGADELGRILMRAFIKTVGDLDPRPGKLIFANAGVRLTTRGSPLIDDLLSLEEAGVTVLSCGTCLDFYGLKDNLCVGVASNMYEIAQSLVEADRVVKP